MITSQGIGEMAVLDQTIVIENGVGRSLIGVGTTSLLISITKVLQGGYRGSNFFRFLCVTNRNAINGPRAKDRFVRVRFLVLGRDLSRPCTGIEAGDFRSESHLLRAFGVWRGKFPFLLGVVLRHLQ